MTDMDANDHGEDTSAKKPAKKPTKEQRHTKIMKIIRELPGIKSIGQLINRLNVEFRKDGLDYKYIYKKHQPLITGDLKELGIKPRRGKGFEFTRRAIRREHINEIESIMELVDVSEGNVFNKAYPMAVKIPGYGQALARVLKKMYGNDIIDILVMESAIVIFCVSMKTLNTITKDLIKITNNEYLEYLNRGYSTDKKNKPSAE